MKLKNKLFLQFGILCVCTINIFGLILINYNFNSLYKNAINSALGEYSIIYTNIESNENIKNIFFSDVDIMKMKSESYLNNTQNSNIRLEFRTLDKEIIYKTKGDVYDYPLEIYSIIDNLSNYIVYNKEKHKDLIINNIIKISGNEYYFTYINNIESLFKERSKNYFTLIKLNIIIGFFLLIIIYIISDEITKPINSLMEGMNKVIDGNYNKKLNYKSNIKEIDSISKNFILMTEEIQNKIEELKYQNKVKQRFIDNLTHEIRTPLTSIIGYSDLMIKKKLTDLNIINQSFERINKEGKRILDLASNLMKLITLDKKTLNISTFNIKCLLEEIIIRFNIKLNNYDVEIILEGDDFEVTSDKELLSILISNLIDNGIKATVEMDIKQVKVTINNGTIVICDTGRGISKDDLNKIFEPFYMVDKSRSRTMEGFGLGLSICSEIIKILNIRINIESELDRGTKVFLIINT